MGAITFYFSSSVANKPPDNCTYYFLQFTNSFLLLQSSYDFAHYSSRFNAMTLVVWVLVPRPLFPVIIMTLNLRLSLNECNVFTREKKTSIKTTPSLCLSHTHACMHMHTHKHTLYTWRKKWESRTDLNVDEVAECLVLCICSVPWLTLAVPGWTWGRRRVPFP